MTVTALLVSHAGAQWLPQVLQGIQAQTRAPDFRVAVDTGGKDESAELVATAWGPDAVTSAPRGTGFGEAVTLGLADAPDSDWVWLLHDDANPAPTALAELLAAAEAHPDAEVLGPKLREWPSLRRLLELGITITGTGRRETGLERGEYDQGQHDDVRAVLAVNTAGMLVRRDVLTRLGGFDRQLPVFGNDLDFGWRAAAAGHRTIVVPQAVVFHAEAAHRGVRRTPLTGRHTHYQERRAALYTLLANCRTRALAFQTVRLGVGTLLRTLGFLLVRSVGQAADELAALLSIYVHPGQIHRARAARRELTTAAPEEVRRLLPPWWLPYRHGLDTVSDFLAAASHQAQDVAERRRAAGLATRGAAPGATAQAEDELAEDTGWVARLVTSPLALAVTAFLVLALIGARAAWGPVSGGALSPAPLRAADWWTLYLQQWHPVLYGTDVPAPAYVPVLALLGTLLAGSATAAVAALLVLAVPVALWGAWRFLRVTGHLVSAAGVSRWVLAGGAAAYAMVPVTSGAWGAGRLGLVCSAALLPWLAHAALGFGDPDPDRRWRAGWRCALLLAVAGAFTPTLWVVAAALALVVLVASAVLAPRALRQRSVVGPPLVALVVAPLLVLPWLLPLAAAGRWPGLLMDAGRLPAETTGFVDLLLGRLDASSGPAGVGGIVLVLAVLALVPRASRLLVLLCWSVALVAAGAAAVLSHLSADLATTPWWPGLGGLLLVTQGAWITAVVVAAGEVLAAVRGRAGRAVGVLVAVAVALTPVLGMVWWITRGTLPEDSADTVPAYMVQSSEAGPAHGVLLIEGDTDSGLGYTVRRGDGTTVGEDEIEALSPEDTDFTADVAALVSAPTAAVVRSLAAHGIEYVVLEAPADGRIAATLDAATGLAQASAEDRSARAWQVAGPVDDAGLVGHSTWGRGVLVGLQGLLLVVVAVLAAPSRSSREREP